MHHELKERDTAAGGPRTESDTVSESLAGLLVIWVGFPVAGGLAGWFLLFAADWIFRLPLVPLPGWLIPLTEYVSGSPYPTLVAISLGILGGIIFTLSTMAELLTVEVGDSGVTLSRDTNENRIPGELIAVAFFEEGHLVILGERSEELACEPCDLDPDQLEAAFSAHGFKWTESDPHADSFRRWMPELPELTAEADDILKARQSAIEDKDEDEARELRSKLNALGVVVRDRDKHQHFRLVEPPQVSSDQNTHSVR